jgi:hypothetical protein
MELKTESFVKIKMSNNDVFLMPMSDYSQKQYVLEPHLGPIADISVYDNSAISFGPLGYALEANYTKPRIVKINSLQIVTINRSHRTLSPLT